MQDDLTLYAQPTARQALGLAVVATGAVLNGLALLHWIAG
jgi:hypothetical protein